MRSVPVSPGMHRPVVSVLGALSRQWLRSCSRSTYGNRSNESALDPVDRALARKPCCSDSRWNRTRFARACSRRLSAARRRKRCQLDRRKDGDGARLDSGDDRLCGGRLWARRGTTVATILAPLHCRCDRGVGDRLRHGSPAGAAARPPIRRARAGRLLSVDECGRGRAICPCCPIDALEAISFRGRERAGAARDCLHRNVRGFTLLA